MCAWKRGAQNNLPGGIRMGHIKEFVTQSTNNSSSTQYSLKILDFNDSSHVSEQLASAYYDSPTALVSSSILTESSSTIDPALNVKDLIYLHSHKFPHSILSCVIHDAVPPGSIVLKDFHLSNAKVCIGDKEVFTCYQGEQFTYDVREGAIGDTKLRYKPLLPVQKVSFSIQLRYPNQSSMELDASLASACIAKALFGCIITKEEVYVFSVREVEYICHVCEIINELDDKYDDESFVIDECYRGIIDASTEVFLKVMINSSLTRNHPKELKAARNHANLVHVITNDFEVFPIKRRLLRPCISLTSIVQHDRGVYKSVDTSSMANNKFMSEHEKQAHSGEIDSDYIAEDLIRVDVDACTFDRVLLYLEHEARNEEFHFDPLIVNDLLEAAKTLGIVGLRECCEKVLGSFSERVRRTPIRLQEIISRNLTGGSEASTGSQGRKKRKETILLLSGMVFDITNWLDEHPGGSSIIPEQALNVDSTIFFEIYHASRQSFLYLKEFYIGELAEEDLGHVKQPTNCPPQAKVSEAFIEQLDRMTSSWRLKRSDMNKTIPTFKSF
jgi:hypothetical protein